MTGLIYDHETLCGNIVCPENFICLKILNNPDEGLTNYDNILNSSLQVYNFYYFYYHY